MRFLVVFLLLVPVIFAEICPMEQHQVCNPDHELFSCVCQVSQSDENPVPEKSCNTLIARDVETNEFPVVSVEFNLDDTTNAADEWPESAFRDKLSSTLRVSEEDIVILRASCTGTDDSLTVQFIVLEKDANRSAIPFQIDDLYDAETIAKRMKAMGHLSQIGNLDVDVIEFTEELIDIEFNPSNLELFLKAVAIGLLFGFFFVLGLLKLFRGNKDYIDDLQKP